MANKMLLKEIPVESALMEKIHLNKILTKYLENMEIKK